MPGRQSGLTFRNHLPIEVQKLPPATTAQAVKPVNHLDRDIADIRDSLNYMKEELKNGVGEKGRTHYLKMIQQLGGQLRFLVDQRAAWLGERRAASRQT